MCVISWRYTFIGVSINEIISAVMVKHGGLVFLLLI